MSSNSDSSKGSNHKFESESDEQTKKVPKHEHTGNKSEKAPGRTVIKKSLDEKISEALKSVSPDKRQTRENLTIKVVPLNVRLSEDNVSYYKITTQVVENSILKTVVTPIKNIYKEEANEEIKASLNRTFITCSRHLKFLLGALSPAYRPQLSTGRHSQPALRKISSQNELNKRTENLKNIESVTRLTQPVSKTSFTKLIFGAVTPSCAAKQHQQPLSVKEKDQQQKQIVLEPTMHKAPEINLERQDTSASVNLLSLQREKLHKKQYKYVVAMKPRNEKELKMKEKLLKLLLHLRNTAEETENIIRELYYQQRDTEHIQQFVNTQLNKTTSSDDFDYAHKKSLESLEKQSAAHLSSEAKRQREGKEHLQKVDFSNSKEKDVNRPLSHNIDMPKDTQTHTFIRSSKKLNEQLKLADISKKSKMKNLHAQRKTVSSKEQKPINIILQKLENRKKTMKLWNNKDYTFSNMSDRNNNPPNVIKETEKKIQEHKTDFEEKKPDALNKNKWGSSSKIVQETAEHCPSLECAEHPKEKRAIEKEEKIQEYKTNSVEKKPDTLNKNKWESSSKTVKETAEHCPSLECAEHPKEKSAIEKQENKTYCIDKKPDTLNKNKWESSSKTVKEKAEHFPSLGCPEHPKEKPAIKKEDKIQERKTYFVDKKPYTLNKTSWETSSKIFKVKQKHNSSLECTEHPNEEPIKEKQKKIQGHKTDFVQKVPDAINETKRGSSSKTLKENTEYSPSLGSAQHPKKKSEKEAYKINSTEQTGIKSVYPQEPQVDQDKLMSSKHKISAKECISNSKNYNQDTNTGQLISLPPKALAEEAHAIEKQSTKFKENKDGNDKEISEHATTLKNQGEEKINQKISKPKMASTKVPAVKRERLRLSRTIRQKGRADTCCKPRVTSQKLSLNANANKANLTKQIKNTGHTENKLNERKATGSLPNKFTDKNKPAEIESKLKDVPQRNEKPFNSNESNSNMPKPEKQRTDLLKSNSTTATGTSTKSQSPKESSSSSKNEDSKNENQNSIQERNALKRKNDIINKKTVINRAAAKAELREIELQRKQELQALKEKLTRPKASLSKTDTYYEYLQSKLKEVPHKGQQTTKVKAFSIATKESSIVVNKKAKTDSLSQKCAVERQKLDMHKGRVLSQKKIDECFKCACCSDKPINYSGSEVTPMPKYGSQHSSSTYEDIKSVMKMKNKGNPCNKLPQNAKILIAPPLKKSHDSKPTLKEVKFTLPSVEKDAEKGIQKLNKTASCTENKTPKIQCAGEKINIERKSKAKSPTDTCDKYNSTQTKHNNLVRTTLSSKPQKENTEAFKKWLTCTPKTNLKHTNERVKDLYSFTATDPEKQPLKKKHNNPKRSIKEMTMLKSSFCAGIKDKQEFKKSLQNKLKRIRGAATNQKADELKAKQVIKKTLLTNIHEAIKVKDLKDGFRNNFHWHILKTGIKNSIHGRQLLNAVKQSIKTLGAGFKGSVNFKELQQTFREGIKHKELFCTVKHSINIPLLFRSLANATKDYTKLKYNTFKKIREESSKKNGGDSNGACSVPKQPSGENSSCDKQKGDVKYQVRGQNKYQMCHLNNTINEEIAAQPLLMKDIRKLMSEILGSLPTSPLKNAEYLQLSHLGKYISKHFIGQNTVAPYNKSRPMLKSVPTVNARAPFSLRPSDFVDDEAKQKSASLNQKQNNASRAVSKEVKYFQGFWQNHGPRMAIRGPANSDMYFKQNALQQLDVTTKAIYEADRNAFISGLSRRLPLNQFLRDFFGLNKPSSNDKRSQSKEAVSEKSPEEALRKLIHDNMHTVNKICISENSVHTANNTLKEKILMFCLKHDMIYVAEDMPKHLLPPISESISDKKTHIYANVQEIQSPSNKDSNSISPRDTTGRMHSSSEKGSVEANITDKEEKPKIKHEKAEPKPEHITLTKPEKLSIQHASNDANLTGLSKYFNSETITGRANVAKATLSCVALGYLYYRASTRSERKRDGKTSK